jgi:hypothetical protein
MKGLARERHVFPATEASELRLQGVLRTLTPVRLRGRFTEAVTRSQDTMPRIQKAVAVLMSILLVLTTFPVGASAQNASPSGTKSGTKEEYGPLSSEELDGIVAPIALYPDALVAQILGAATFPYEIVDATLWLKDNTQLKGEALAKAVDQQSWDPAVKALTQFPSVLDNLAKNLAWTSALGEASATQQSDVMAAVQRMRAKAQAAGNLKSSPEIKVVQESPQTIVIQPANPQIVYVPVYNPAVIYGVPYVYPGYVYVAPPPSTAVIAFGVGVAVGAMVYGGCCGWGWSYWGTSWHSHTIIYNRNIYVGNSYWRGGYYGGGYRPGYPAYRPGAPGYRPGYPGYGRPPGYRPPATTLPSPGNRPGNRPPATTLPTGAGTRPNAPGGGSRPGGGTPGTLPANGGNRPNQTPGTRPSTNEARGYQRPQTSNTGAAQAARPNAFSGSGGGRAESARGNRSVAAKGGRGGR